MPQDRQRPTNKDAISAAKEIVDLVGFGLGNLMLRIHQGNVHKNYCTDDWTDADRDSVRGTVLFLLGGSIGTHGYMRQILPLIAQRRIGEVDTEFAKQVCIFTPAMESAQAGALGAYFLAVPETAKQIVQDRAKQIYSRKKIPLLPLLDVGGTKVNLILAYVDQEGLLTLDILQSHRFATPTGEPDVFYQNLASLLAVPLSAIQASKQFELIPILAVGQPGRFNDPKGAIGSGTAKDLGPNFQGCIPSECLEKLLRNHVEDIDVYCANDGRSQFMGMGMVGRKEDPLKWGQLKDKPIAYLGLGTGLGAGFGHIDDEGRVKPFSMHNAFDIEASYEFEEIPSSSYLPNPVLKAPYPYVDLLSGRFFQNCIQNIDLARLKDRKEMLFVPNSSARHISTEQATTLLEHGDRLSPLGAVLINEILADEIVTARTEQIVERHRPELEKKLVDTLSTIAHELGVILLRNVRTSNYEKVIEEVARVKRRGRRVQFLGIGKSHSIGRNLAYIYSNLGIDSASCELTGANSENLTNLREDDLVFLISNSGRAAELLDLIPYIHRKNCLTVTLTGDDKSPMAKHCSFFVSTHVDCNPCSIPEAPTTSTTAALAVGTAIGMVVSYLFDYDAGDFFLDHPNLQFKVDFPVLGVRADASFDRLAKVEDIFRLFAKSVSDLTIPPVPQFVTKMISLTKRILVSHYNGRTVFFTGAGATLRIAEKVAATLTSIGIDASAVNSAQLPHGDFAHIRSGDLMVIISYSGETRQLLRIHEIARQKRVDCAVITSSPESSLAQKCSEELCVVAGKGANDTDLVPIPDQKILSSFINLTVGDALAVVLAEVLGRTSKDFAEDAHPGGEIARKQSRLKKLWLSHLGEDLAQKIASNPKELEKINQGLSVRIEGEHLQSYNKRRLVATQDVPEVMIFGMGAIGLAYLAPIFSDLGKMIWFVESNRKRIAAMQRIGYQYKISVASDRSAGASSDREIGRVSVIADTDRTSIIATALRVDTIFTSVGIANIKGLLPTLADIIRLRYQFWLEEPLNIVFSENFPVEEDPLASLRHDLRERLDDAELKVYFDEYIGLVPAIDEAVVPEVNANSLDRPIVIERDFAVLFIDRLRWRPHSRGGDQPTLGERVVFTDSLLPLHMRKLWVHNMGHAMLGYLGYWAGFKRVVDAVRDPHIEEVVKRAMIAIGRELHRRWSYRETKQQTLDEYVDWRWARYDNEALNDTIDRVCRDPQRKLKRDDRLIGPINYIRKYATRGQETDQAIVDILVGVVAAMHYAVDVRKTDINSLREQVLDDLVNVDSELLNRAERWFDKFRKNR